MQTYTEIIYRDELQMAFVMLTLWSEQWLLKLNFSKCSILYVKRREPILYEYYIKEDTCDMHCKGVRKLIFTSHDSH